MAVAAVALLLTLTLAGCGSSRVLGNSTDIATVTTDNDLVPQDQNLSDCVGTLERPDCGAPKKSDLNMYLTFGVLMAGMGFIGWRIFASIRKRDRDLEEHLPEHTY